MPPSLHDWSDMDELGADLATAAEPVNSNGAKSIEVPNAPMQQSAFMDLA